MASRSAARFATATVVLLALGMPALFGPWVGQRMWELTGEIDAASAYLPWIEPALLYVWMPLTVLASLVIVMAPGMLLALALGQAFSFELWLLRGFCWSVVVLGVVTAAIQAFTGTPLIGIPFCMTAMSCSVLAGTFAVLRARGRDLAWPTLEGAGVVGVFVVPLLLLVGLTPKFFWEAFNGDGAHAFEAARLLLHYPLPFWPDGSGNMAPFPGLNSSLFTYPTAWFIRIFGEFESGVRLPYLLFVVLLFAGLRALAHEGRPGRLGGWSTALMWLSLGSFSLVMAYSATYDPYCSDIGLPATQDSLLVACFLGLVVAYMRRERGWTAVFALACLLCSPGGPILVGGWFVALIVGSRRREWGRLLEYAALVAFAVVVVTFLPRLLDATGLPAPGQEHTAGALLSKFRYVIFGDYGRLLWVIVPAGVYPAMVLFSVRKADDGTRALVALWFATLAMYYFMAFVSLHYFVPAMLLPLAAFWRHHRPEEWASPQPMLLACYVAAFVTLGLGTPRGSAIYLGTRQVGMSIDTRRLPGYDSMQADYFSSMDLIEQLFTPGWRPEVPRQAYAGSAAAWNFYSRRAPADARLNYVLQPLHAPAPAGAQRVAGDEVAALWVLDDAVWEAHRALQPLDSNGRPLYKVSRDVLFHRQAAFEELPIIDVKALLQSADDTEGH